MRLHCQCIVKMFLLLLCCGYLRTSTLPISPVVQIGFKSFQIINSIKTAVSTNMFQESVKRSLKDISENIQEIKGLIISESNNIIQKIFAKIDMQTVKEFKRTVHKIDQRYEDEFVKYFMENNNNNTYNQRTIEDYIISTTSSLGFRQTLSLINDYTVPISYDIYPRKDTVFDILHNDIQIRIANGQDCGIGQSGHQQLYALYNLALMAVTKGYIMVAHAYKYLQQKESNENSFKLELRDAKERYTKSVFKISEAARHYLMNESKIIRQCDPAKYIEGKNYKSYKFLSTYLVPNRVFTIPKNRKCSGEIRSCIQNYNIDGACLAAPETGRVYEYVTEHGGDFDWRTYTKGRIKGKCSSENSLFYLRQFLDWKMCLCEEPYSQKKGAIFNMTAQLTDIANNRVVTGIRFVSKWSITYIEIQSGQLVNGTIDPSTVKWHDEVTHILEDNERRHFVLPNDFYIHKEKNTIHPDYIIGENPYFNNEMVDLKYSRISFNLDDIVLPTGMVVAGVKFEMRDLGKNSHIVLMVAGWKVYDGFGYPTDSEPIKWFSAEDIQRSQLNLKNRDIPTEGPKANLQLSEPGKKYVKFEMTGWNVDASQTVIPFLDLTEVTTNPPVPLGGIGLVHKAQERYGGFISLKLITTDYTFFMSDVCLNNTLTFGNNPLIYLLAQLLSEEKRMAQCIVKY